MNFNNLYKRIHDIDKGIVAECGEMPMSSSTPTTTPPSMSVSLNAQGMENIESLLKLMTKVNPDMMPKNDMPLPTMTDPVIKLGMSKPDMGGDEELEDGFDAATTHPNPEYKDISASIPDGNDMHKPKKGYPAAAGGDNPRAMGEGENLVNSIKAQLLAQLAEHKKQ